MRHRWTALGGGPMTSAQARQWAGAEAQTLVAEPLAVQFAVILCAVCLRDAEEAGSSPCLGPPDDDAYGHLWQVFLTAMVTDEQAHDWATTSDGLDIDNPQSVAVLCLLCGQGAEDAPDECPERTLWR